MLRVCWTLAVLAVCLAVSTYRGVAAADEALYPHAVREGGPWGYIDKTGKVVIPLQFDAAQPFSEGLAAVKRNRKFGFINRTGRLVIEHQFDDVRPFKGSRAAVMVGGAWGLIDEAGASLAPPTFRWIRPFSDGLAVVNVRGKQGAIDLAGKLVVAPEYDQIYSFSEGLAAVRQARSWGYIDREGHLAIPLEPKHQARSFTNGLAKISRFQPVEGPQRVRLRAGFIDRQGRVAIPFDFDEANEFSEGLATVNVPGKGWGAIDETGKFVIPPQFSNVGVRYMGFDMPRHGQFSEGLLTVAVGNAFGYVDRQGRFAVPPRFQHAQAFQDGLAVVRLRSDDAPGGLAGSLPPAGVIDRTGKLVVRPVFDRITIHPGGAIQVWLDGRVGYLDATGRPLTLTEKDIDDHVARKREQLLEADKRHREYLARVIGPPPEPGRAIIGKAGDTEYYLRLPDGMCALSSASEDRKHLEDFWAKEAAEAQEVAKKLPQTSEKQPQISEDTLRELRKSSEELKRNFGLIANCEQLKSFRASGNWKALRTYAVAAGMQKDRYDFSRNAGIVYMAAFMCTVAEKGKLGMPPSKEVDNSVRIWTAFKRLEAGESTSLGALAREPLACYSAALSPLESDAGTPPGAPPKARVAFHAMAFLPDWLVQVFTKDVTADSPEALLQELEREKAVVRALQNANFKGGPTKY